MAMIPKHNFTLVFRYDHLIFDELNAAKGLFGVECVSGKKKSTMLLICLKQKLSTWIKVISSPFLIDQKFPILSADTPTPENMQITTIRTTVNSVLQRL